MDKVWGKTYNGHQSEWTGGGRGVWTVTDKKILNILQGNARISMKELGTLVGLTSPAVTERVRRLEEEGTLKDTGPL